MCLPPPLDLKSIWDYGLKKDFNNNHVNHGLIYDLKNILQLFARNEKLLCVIRRIPTITV